MTSRSTKPPKPTRPPQKISGQQQRYEVGTPDPNKETHVPCPICSKGLVPASVAGAVKDALRQQSDGPTQATPVPRKASRK